MVVPAFDSGSSGLRTWPIPEYRQDVHPGSVSFKDHGEIDDLVEQSFMGSYHVRMPVAAERIRDECSLMRQATEDTVDYSSTQLLTKESIYSALRADSRMECQIDFSQGVAWLCLNWVWPVVAWHTPKQRPAIERWDASPVILDSTPMQMSKNEQTRARSCCLAWVWIEEVMEHEPEPPTSRWS